MPPPDMRLTTFWFSGQMREEIRVRLPSRTTQGMTFLALLIAILATPTLPYISHPLPRVTLYDSPQFRNTKPINIRPIE